MFRRTFVVLPLLACAIARAESPSSKVIERYKQMLAANPVEGTALDRLWQAYSEQGKTADLLAEFEKGRTFSSNLVLGHLLRKAGRPEEAAAAYQRAEALDTRSPLPAIALGRLEKSAGRHAKAAEHLARAAGLLEKGTQKTETLIDLGAEWLAADDAAKAVEAWEQTIAFDPGNLDLRRRLADGYVRQHLTERAIPHLEYLQAHASPQERALALQQLANVQQLRGDQDAAIAALDRALTYTGPGNWLRAELQAQLVRLYQRYHRTS